MQNGKNGQSKSTFKVALEVVFLREGKYIVAYCPALELTSYGKNKRIAERRFREVLEIYFEETIRNGTLEKDLLELGWTLRKKPSAHYSPPRRMKPLIELPSDSEHIQKQINIPV